MWPESDNAEIFKVLVYLSHSSGHTFIMLILLIISKNNRVLKSMWRIYLYLLIKFCKTKPDQGVDSSD